MIGVLRKDGIFSLAVHNLDIFFNKRKKTQMNNE